MGAVHNVKARYELQHGLDPRPTVAAGAELLREAFQLKPTYVYPYVNMADLYATQAWYEVALGMDPRASSDRAVEACQQAIQRMPGFYGSFDSICRAQLAAAQYELMSGISAQVTLDRAVENCTKALEFNPADLESHQNMSIARRMIVLHRLERGLDAADSLADARAAVRKALEINASAPPILVLQGQIEVVTARLATKATEEPAEILRAAGILLKRALQQGAASAELFETMAEIHLLQAEWRARRRRPLEQHVAQGLAMVEEALQVNPRAARAEALSGALHLVKARNEGGRAGRQDAARRARGALEKAIQNNPLLRREFGPLLVEVERLIAPPSSSP